jgi:mono/diheme cytochrome c family protein
MARWLRRGSVRGGALGLAVLACAGAAQAQDRAEVSRGHALARAWCADCHGVEPGEATGTFETPPSFQTFAQNPEVTETALKAYLQSTHPLMPQVKLSPDEIEEIVAYILSLKRG